MRTLLITAITTLAFISTAIAGPIHDAAKAGDVAKVRQLLANGAKVNAREGYGHTPLHKAASADIAKWLLAAGANVNARTKDGRAPLHYAGSAAIANELVKAGAKVDARNMHGMTPLHWAAAMGSGEVVKLLLEAGADGSLKDEAGRTPFDMEKESGKLQKLYPDAYWLLNDARFK